MAQQEIPAPGMKYQAIGKIRRTGVMKKLFTLFAAALVMLAAASCEKNEVLPEGNTEGKVVTLKASINNGETKTSLGAQGTDRKYPVLWTLADNDTDREADAIAVIQNGIVYKFNLVSVDDNGQGTFELDAQENENEFDKNGEIKAFYPYAGVTCNGGTIKYNIPDTQVYVEKSFGNGASPMAAYRAAGNNEALDFQNLFGALKLQIKGMEGEKVQSIEIRSSYNIAGEARFELEETEGGVQEFVLRVASLDGTSCVTLDCENYNGGVSIQELTSFLIALHPDATELKVFIHTDKASYYKTIPTLDVNETPINDITAGNILAMGGLNTADMAPAYIDEQGIYQGDGIEVSGIIWAPVNCGYDDDHKYGLLYQWGRKDGQDYSIDSEYITTLGDNTSPEYDIFYTDWNPTYTVWSDENSPCPTGWRVPTETEFTSSLSTDINSGEHNGTDGFWFDEYKVFFPAAGYRQNDGTANGRNSEIRYWTSTKADNNQSKYIKIQSGGVVGPFISYFDADRACGFSVRCVKDTPQSEPMPSGN